MINFAEGFEPEEPQKPTKTKKKKYSPEESDLIIERFIELLQSSKDRIDDVIVDIVSDDALLNADDIGVLLDEKGIELGEMLKRVYQYESISELIEKLQKMVEDSNDYDGETNEGQAMGLILHFFISKFSIPEGEYENFTKKIIKLREILIELPEE